MTLIFGMYIDLDGKLLIFGISRSKVKVIKMTKYVNPHPYNYIVRFPVDSNSLQTVLIDILPIFIGSLPSDEVASII